LLSDVLNNLGSCFYTNDDVDEALCIFEKALELAGVDTSRQASTLYNEGLCYARKEEFAKAKELWSKSLTLYQTLQSAVEITKVQHNLREVDKKQKREFLQENYERVKQTGTTADIEKAYKELVRFLMDEFTA
jgi:Tfp pilus assembly protein PilF